MRYTLFIVLMGWGSIAYAQPKATTFQQAKAQGLSLEKLDSLYTSALHADTTKAVFSKQEKEFYANYTSMLKELGTFLKAHGFVWHTNVKCFNRIYFNASGKIDYFLFNFYPNQITKEKEKQFEQLVNTFIQNYQFAMTADRGFAQCSPVTYASTK